MELPEQDLIPGWPFQAPHPRGGGHEVIIFILFFWSFLIIFYHVCKKMAKEHFLKNLALLGVFPVKDLLRNLDLTKSKAEILGSRLQQWNLLDGKVKTSFRDRNKSLVSFFNVSNNNLVSCNDIHGLFEELGVPYNPSNWRLFIDASKYSL